MAFKMSSNAMKKRIQKEIRMPGDGREFAKHATDKALMVMLAHSPGARWDWVPCLINTNQWVTTALCVYEARSHTDDNDTPRSKDEHDDFALDVIDEALAIVQQPLIQG